MVACHMTAKGGEPWRLWQREGG